MQLNLSHTVFEILTRRARKLLVLPTPIVCRPRSRNPSEYLDETYPAKTRGMGLPYDQNCMIIINLTVFDGSTRLTDGDGRTDKGANRVYSPPLKM